MVKEHQEHYDLGDPYKWAVLVLTDDTPERCEWITKDHLDRALQNLRDHTIPAEPVQRLASRVLWEWGEFMAVVKRHGLAEEVAIKVEEMEPWIADLEKALEKAPEATQ